MCMNLSNYMFGSFGNILSGLPEKERCFNSSVVLEVFMMSYYISNSCSSGIPA